MINFIRVTSARATRIIPDNEYYWLDKIPLIPSTTYHRFQGRMVYGDLTKKFDSTGPVTHYIFKYFLVSSFTVVDRGYYFNIYKS